MSQSKVLRQRRARVGDAKRRQCANDELMIATMASSAPSRAAACSMVLAALLMLLYFTSRSMSLPAMTFRLGLGLLGACDEPVLLRTVPPLRNESFHSLLKWLECGACSQAQEVPSWSASCKRRDARVP